MLAILFIFGNLSIGSVRLVLMTTQTVLMIAECKIMPAIPEYFSASQHVGPEPIDLPYKIILFAGMRKFLVIKRYTA